MQQMVNTMNFFSLPKIKHLDIDPEMNFIKPRIENSPTISGTSSVFRESYTPTKGTFQQEQQMQIIQATQFTIWLVKMFDQLMPENKDLVSQLASMFTPYQEEEQEQEINFNIDLQPSRHFIATVTRREEPQIYLD